LKRAVFVKKERWRRGKKSGTSDLSLPTTLPIAPAFLSVHLHLPFVTDTAFPLPSPISSLQQIGPC
jgi:hypothetical protein